jgi:N-ethylmaleimide reductase
MKGMTAAPPQEEPLFAPYRLGSLALANRMVMAPMTRSRALPGGVPNPMAARYYAQRASAGLIVTEATQVSSDDGYFGTPGIYATRQIAAWHAVVDAVHAARGKIFLQLWHTGRTSHPDLCGGQAPGAPSPIAAAGDVRVAENVRKLRVTPRALTVEEIARIVEDFRQAAQNARDAGFDGVEIHGANGYLLDQFTRDGPNHRLDQYGGDIANRARLPLEVARAVVDALGGDRVGYRISPLSTFNSMTDTTPLRTFSYLTAALSDLGVSYLHVIDPAEGEARVTLVLRKLFKQTYIVNSGFDAQSASQAIRSGEADLVAFGVPFLANPDLPQRYATRAALNSPDRSTFYTSGGKGYIDYPSLAE